MGMALVLILVGGCGHNGGDAEEAVALPEVKVRTGEAEERGHMRRQGLPGTVYPADQAVIAAKVMGTVAEADVDIGQRVTEGELLIRLSAGEIVAQVEQADALLAQLERNYEREKALLQQNATTAESVRTLEDQMRLARAQRAEAETMESYTRIRAPFDGIITTREVRRGDLALPGVPLLTVEGIAGLEVHVQVPDSLMQLPYGEAVSISSDGTTTSARLVEWSPAADPASRTRLAKLELAEDTTLRSGQYVRVDWPAGHTESVWMPAQALSPMGQMERVFVIENGRAELRLVKAGRHEGEWVQILSGLGAGERVVLQPPVQLMDGQPVSVEQ